jgi:hypothetical protein
MTFLPCLPLRSHLTPDALLARIRELHWFHKIDFGEVVTEGLPYDRHWSWVAGMLQDQARLIQGRSFLEFGPADGLWSCWLTRLGAASIVAADVASRDEYRLVIESFALPVEYHPCLLSTDTPRVVRRQFDGVVSLGVLYHVHDPLTTLLMYQRYLKESGLLILEGGTLLDDVPALYYTGNGFIYGHEGGNQFIPSLGFLREALEQSLGLRILRLESRAEFTHSVLGKQVARTLIVAVKEGRPNVHYYPILLESLGMQGEEFGPIEWCHPIELYDAWRRGRAAANARDSAER